MTPVYISIAGLLLISVALLVTWKLGKSDKERELQEIEIELGKKARENAEKIINRKRGDGFAKLRKLQQDKHK